MSKVVVQVCCGDWGGPAQANTARKTLPLPSKHLFQCLEGTKKESVLGEGMGCGGEVKAQNSQGWCRGWVGIWCRWVQNLVQGRSL